MWIYNPQGTGWFSVELLVVALAVEDPQDGEEQVDDVQVKRDRGSDFLLYMVVPHDKLRVHEDISAKYQSRQSPIYQLDCATWGEKRSHEAEENEEPECPEQVWHPVGKVIFGLASEEGQGDEDPESQYEGLDDDARAVEGRYDADRVGFEGGKGREEEEVCRVTLPFPVCEKHEYDSANEGHDHQP